MIKARLILLVTFLFFNSFVCADKLSELQMKAEDGDASAQLHLGLIFYNGQGVTQNYVQAHKWWNISAADGNEQARKNRDIVQNEMTKEQVAEAQQLARQWMEAQLTASQRIATRIINVKYRSTPVDVNNGTFVELALKPSSVVKEIFFDASAAYLLVRLKNTFYHYCGVDNATVRNWENAGSLGRFYGQNIKGNFDCRINPMPDYE